MNRDKLWEKMDNKIPNYLLNTIKCIYRNTKVIIKFNFVIFEPVYINKGVREGCGFSPALFNIYINKIIQEFKIVLRKGIQLYRPAMLRQLPTCRLLISGRATKYNP